MVHTMLMNAFFFVKKNDSRAAYTVFKKSADQIYFDNSDIIKFVECILK